jgi:type III secretory pathway component EscV
LWAQGQYAEAQAAADSAKKFVKWSVIAGVVVAVIYGILIALGAMNTDVNTAMVAFDVLNLG